MEVKISYSHPKAKAIAPQDDDAGTDLCCVEDFVLPAMTDEEIALQNYFIQHPDKESDFMDTVMQNAHHYNDDMELSLAAVRSETFYPSNIVKVNTHIRIAIPKGYVGMIVDRSSVGVGSEKNKKRGGVKVFGGIIDSGYTGDIIVGLGNLTNIDQHFDAGEKIAQLLIIPCLQPELVVVESLDESNRGSDGFGSTGR